MGSARAGRKNDKSKQEERAAEETDADAEEAPPDVRAKKGKPAQRTRKTPESKGNSCDATNDNKDENTSQRARTTPPAGGRSVPARPKSLAKRPPASGARETTLDGDGVAALAARLLPPQRPARPARQVAAGAGMLAGRYRTTRYLSRYQGLSAQAMVDSERPNRYAWAQFQHWAPALGGGGARPGAKADGRELGQPGESLALDSKFPGAVRPHFSSHLSSAASRVLVVNPMHMVNLSEHTKSRLIKIIEALKRFSEKWFSHVLLLLFLATYACFGAYVFLSFEAPTERWEKRLIMETRRGIVNDTWASLFAGANSTSGGPPSRPSLNESAYRDLLMVKLEGYEKVLARACASGITGNSLESQWDFWGALFYSMTVFTTIGYGQITPVTFAGRAATVVYAVFGIPILLMVLADLGKLLTRIIKYTFRKLRHLYVKLIHRKSSIRTRKIISHNAQQLNSAAQSFVRRHLLRLRQRHIDKPLSSVRQRLRGCWLQRATKWARRPRKPAATSGGGPAEPPDGSEPAACAGQQAEAGAAADETPNAGLQETQVIVTPTRQSKPVSPQPGRHASAPGFVAGAVVGEAPRLAHACQRHRHLAGHHHAHQHHSACHQHRPAIARSRSPSGGADIRRAHRTLARRKSSSSNAAKPARAVSRSSSSSQLVQQRGAKPAANGQPSLFGSGRPEACPAGPAELQPGGGGGGGGGGSADEPEEEPAACVGAAGRGSELARPTDSAEPAYLGEPPEEPDEELELFSLSQDETVNQEQGSQADQEDNFDIPVSFALFLLVAYMVLGAAIFSIWERWNFFDALYFVFISMSTIGFGDLVPEQQPKRMLGTFIYLLFGLALTSMCINVVQEKIHATFLRAKLQIGEKMGLDLDQIMADDYYDGSPTDDYDCHSSLAASQAHSSTGNLHLPALAPDSRPAAAPAALAELADQCQECLAEAAGNEPAAGGSARLSRGSSASLRSRPRRCAAGAGLLRKQLSSKRAQAPGSGPRSPAPVQTLPPSVSVSRPAASPADVRLEALLWPSSGAPLRPPGSPGERKSAATGAPTAACAQPAGVQHSGSSLELQPLAQSLKLPTSASVICKSMSSEFAGSSLRDRRLARRADFPRSPLSAGSSRRSSVSQELNQLDDLIQTLGRKSADERFAPLLGIPARGARSGRASRLSAHSRLASARRGTSLISRASPSSPGNTTNAANLANPANPGHPKQPESRAALQEQTSVPTKRASTLGTSSSLIESQRAIDELEALKLSVV